MKTNFLLLYFAFILFSSSCFAQTCNNWLKLSADPSYLRMGDLDVPGNKVTVEALINRTASYPLGNLYAGDIVSKHRDPDDVNYLLRPNHAEITTTNGYFKTPDVCPIELNKTYHVAMVYDGITLKFYRNGYLLSQIPATGNIIQNDWPLQIGRDFHMYPNTNFIGYINEVRIWNTARTQNEIRAYINTPLPAPTSQQGLLAYYTFDNLINKQGNTAWNGTLSGTGTSINNINPNCSIPASFPSTQKFEVCKSIKIGSAVKGARYVWNTGATSDSIVVNSSGTYWVESNQNGCTMRDSFIVAVKSPCDSVKITGPEKICSRTDTVVYSVYKPPVCTRKYSLTTDNTFVQVISESETNLKLVFKNNGITSIKVSYTDSCQIVADSIIVSIKFSPDHIDFGPSISACKDTLITLHAGDKFESYQWQNGSTDSVLIVNTAGVYVVQAKNFCGASFKDTFNFVKASPAPFKAIPLRASVCKGDLVQFSASGGTNYSWEPRSNFNNPDIASPKALISSSQDFAVQIWDTRCLRDTVIFIQVEAREKAVISVTKKNDVDCQLDSTVLLAKGGVSYIWTPNLFVSRSAHDQITVKPHQTITYYVQGKDATGCTGEDSVTIFFTKEGEQRLFAPNAFTPNNDGLNDVFKPVFTGPALKFDFRIFNRWGQLLFQTNSHDKGWDGKFKGVTQPNDAYVFYITAEGDCNGKFEQKGTFVLIK